MLSQVAKVLKLTRVQEVVFALGLTNSTDTDLQSHGKPKHIVYCFVKIVY